MDEIVKRCTSQAISALLSGLSLIMILSPFSVAVFLGVNRYMKNRYVKGFLTLLPGIAVIVASLYGVQIKAPALALDEEAIAVIQDSVAYADSGAGASGAARKKPKINRSAAASARGAAAGNTGAAASAGGSRKMSHDSSLDNATFRDGTYTGSAQGFSGTVKVSVTIKGGKISSIKVLSNSDTPSYFNRARKVISRMISKQSTRVDTVSGATFSSNGIIKATERALKKAAVKSGKKSKASVKTTDKASAAKKKTSATSAKTYKDGTYTGSATGYHGLVTVKVTVKGGKISSVQVVSHSDTKSYFDRAKTLIANILKQQTPDVDTVAGATKSSNGIINAVRNALKGAEAGTQPPKDQKPTQTGDKPSGADVLNTKYENGTYEGSAVGYTDNTGLQCMTWVVVTVKDNKIASVVAESQDQTMSGDDWYWEQAYPAVSNAIVKANNPDVDAVSGATMSSNGIMNAVKDALKGHELKEETRAKAASKALKAAPATADENGGAEQEEKSSASDPADVPEQPEDSEEEESVAASEPAKEEPAPEVKDSSESETVKETGEPAKAKPEEEKKPQDEE